MSRRSRDVALTSDTTRVAVVGGRELRDGALDPSRTRRQPMNHDMNSQDAALSHREIAIVHALVEEGSVRKAAAQVGLSERHTRRILGNLQEQLEEPNIIALALRVVRAYPPGPDENPDEPAGGTRSPRMDDRRRH